MSLEQDSNNEDRLGFWIDKLRKDSDTIGEERKIEIFRTLLSDYIGLTKEETNAFLAESTPLEKGGIPTNESLTYLSAERKVSNFYAVAYDEGTTLEREDFLLSFRKTLTGFYSEGELDEMLGFLELDAPRSDTTVVQWLVGSDHYIFRRIRNAYLPLITDVISIGPDGGGDIDIFDTDEEPVETIHRLLGGKPNH